MSPLAGEARARRRLLFVSTYPPTRCGLASFCQSLVDSIDRVAGGRAGVGVVRLRSPEDDTPKAGGEAETEVIPGVRGWVDEVVASSRGFDLLWLQHEYGIFGPNDGEEVLSLCDESPLPIALTLHSVPAAPTCRQRRILETMCGSASLVVVMTNAARRRLLMDYAIDPAKVMVIPHGAPLLRRSPLMRAHGRPTIVNWGLIGPGKGLEWGIGAMALLRHLQPLPELLIKGSTHPNVELREGERYREDLIALISDLDLADSVRIESGYMSSAELELLKLGADLVLLPYDSMDQVTSGVLVEALAARLPVVATEFPHAVELLSGGAGVVVPHRDPEATAQAIESLITDPSALKAAAAAAARVGAQLSWPHVARQYLRLSEGVIERPRTSVA